MKASKIMVAILKSAPRENMTREELVAAREERSKKYKVEISGSSNLTYPSGYPRELELYADPVNLKFPVDTPARAANARVRFKQHATRIYDEVDSQRTVHNRIITAELDQGIIPGIDPLDPLDKLISKELVERIESLERPDAVPSPEKLEDTDAVPKRTSSPPKIQKAKPGSPADDRHQRKPAKPSERRSGSSRNKPGTATRGGAKDIKLSNATMSALKDKVKEHNEKHGEKQGKKVTTAMLAAVYRRGAGAFSQSHRPGMTRGQWAFARVNHFLRLVRTGRPADPKYITDNDLLPKDHPKRTRKADYSKINFKPPAGVLAELKLGLKWHKEGHSGDGLLPETVAWATRMVNGSDISPAKARKMRAWLARHESDKKGEGFDRGEKGFPSAGRVAWALWGGDPAVTWSNKIVEQMERQEMKKNDETHSCPLATQNLEENTKNRDKAQDADWVQYGPLNVDKPGDYWDKIADHWDTTLEAAKESLCKNCVAFDISPRMQTCMPGPVSEGTGQLGYCWMHHFKCHSERTCKTWAKGGPINEDEKSYAWQTKALAEKMISEEDALKLDVDEEVEKMIRASVLRDNVVAHMTRSFLDDYPKSIGKNVGEPLRLELTKSVDGDVLTTRLSEEMEYALIEKAEAHNDLYGDEPSAVANPDTLKKVALRAAQDGAQATADIVARVNKFLELLATGQRPEPFYTDDNDLLPVGHVDAIRD